ncbi:LysR family transcriptional regulator [Nocardioides panacisoli]|uniref:LysR substrate-binding domain-containing protein n=1 Tax=Nocardioides panacisoli TaxID=627624 RepID=UPI001C63460D|nr:LysR substrate-binding domain-containing protein [Nocardioides panacisoli]QYJ03064.1 LysR family transcriptional regulator [Nocardioides panacisoli]
MELRHLRYFRAVAEEKHFGRAAERLHMAQPPLSQQIRQLEDELGVRLLDRTTRRVELTAAGRAYLDRVRVVLGEVEAAGDEARRIASGVEGRLVIGCVGSATYSLLPALVVALRREFPLLDVAVRGEMLVPDQVAELMAHRLDVALLRPPVEELGVRLTTLRRDGLIVLLPDTHPLASRRRLRVEDLRGQDMVVHASRRSVMHGAVVSLCREAGFEPHVRHEVEETSTLVTFVAAGLGIAVVPEPVAALGVDGVTHRPLASPSAYVDLAAAVRAEDDRPAPARALQVLATVLAQT